MLPPRALLLPMLACGAPLWWTGCLPAEPPDVEDETSMPTLSVPSGSDTSLPTAHRSALRGEAVATSSAFAGTESLEITDVDGGLLCRWTWDTLSRPFEDAFPADAPDCALPDGSPCLFAHAVALTDGRLGNVDTGTDLDCDAFRGLYAMQTEGGVKGYGYGVSDEGEFLLVFADNPAPEPDLWIPLPGAATYLGDVLEYTLDWKQETVR